MKVMRSWKSASGAALALTGQRCRQAVIGAAAGWACLGAWEVVAAPSSPPQVHSGLRVMAPMPAGLWRTTTEMSGQAPSQHTSCTSVQDMDEYLQGLQLQDGHCDTALVSNEAQRAELHMRCAPLGTVEALGVLEVTATSAQAYRVSLRMHNPVDGQALQSIQHFERLKACDQ